MRALVIGGTGPTGPHVVNGLLERGYEVAILHTGRHESDEIPDVVEHIHTDPFDGDAVAGALGDRTFDLCASMYGRLRVLAPLLAGRVGRLISIGGVGATRGWVDPRDLTPAGMPVPTPEAGFRAPLDEPLRKIRRIVETEDVVFAHHPDAVHLRYPMIYGPRQLLPREWSFVRRALDCRPHLIVADGGLTVKSMAAATNAAHAVMCAVDRPEVGGRVYNVTDSRLLTVAQMAEVIATALGHEWELVSMPWEIAAPARPFVQHWSSGHRVVDTHRLRSELGYVDLVDPVEALAESALALAASPLDYGGAVESRLEDPFDYDAEDRLIADYRSAMAPLVASMPSRFQREPGYGAAYYGREENPGGFRRDLLED